MRGPRWGVCLWIKYSVKAKLISFTSHVSYMSISVVIPVTTYTGLTTPTLTVRTLDIIWTVKECLGPFCGTYTHYIVRWNSHKRLNITNHSIKLSYDILILLTTQSHNYNVSCMSQEVLEELPSHNSSSMPILAFLASRFIDMSTHVCIHYNLGI